MEVLTPSGVPRTNGEVYAIVRRRRDERTAKNLPPFALQQQLVSGYPLLQQNFYQNKQQQMQNRAKNAAGDPQGALVTSAPPLTVLLTEVLVLQYLTHHADLSSSSLSIVPPESRRAAAHDDMATGSPSEEPASLASASTTPDVKGVWKALPVMYGPGSMYDPAPQHHGTPLRLPNGTVSLAGRPLGLGKNTTAALKKAKQEVEKPLVVSLVGEDRKKMEASSLWTAQDKLALAEAQDVFFAEKPETYAALVAHWFNRLTSLPCPSSHPTAVLQSTASSADNTRHGGWLDRRERERCHVQAVDILLYVYETHGRHQEKQWAAAIRRLVQQVYRCRVRQIASNGLRDGALGGVGGTLGKPLYFLAPPTSLQTIARGIQHMSPLISQRSEEEAAAIAPAQVPPQFLLTEMDVIQLINARPQRELDAYRVLDDFSSKWDRWVQCVEDGRYPFPAELQNPGAGDVEHPLDESAVPQDLDSFMTALVEIFQKPIIMDV